MAINIKWHDFFHWPPMYGSTSADNEYKWAHFLLSTNVSSHLSHWPIMYRCTFPLTISWRWHLFYWPCNEKRVRHYNFYCQFIFWPLLFHGYCWPSYIKLIFVFPLLCMIALHSLWTTTPACINRHKRNMSSMVTERTIQNYSESWLLSVVIVEYYYKDSRMICIA